MSKLFDQFRARAEAVSAEVHRFDSAADARDFIAGFVSTEAAEVETVWALGPILGGIPGMRFDVTRDRAQYARIGITEMEGGIAATGTLITDATAVDRRLASTLPPIHIAVLATDTIQPDMAAAFARINPRKASYISLITGPSRTADIERVLTIGVHGPKRLIIVCVDQKEAN